MACRLIGAKPLSEPMLEYYYLDPSKQISVKFQSEFKYLNQENGFENVVLKMSAILSRPHYVKIAVSGRSFSNTATDWLAV